MKNHRRRKRGADSYRAGYIAEIVAALLLFFKGYRILGQRIRTPYGEIDILAAQRRTLVLVEVKKRSDACAAAAAISAQQQQRLRKAASHIKNHYRYYKDIRCDAVLFTPHAFVQHIKNAWGA